MTKLTEQKMTLAKMLTVLETAKLINVRIDYKSNVKFLNLTRHISYNGKSVETWYDRKSQNWITQVKENGYQVGTCDYNGFIESAAVSHIFMIVKVFTGKEMDI